MKEDEDEEEEGVGVSVVVKRDVEISYLGKGREERRKEGSLGRFYFYEGKM